MDAEKDAQDEETRMANGTLPYDQACARGGLEAEDNIKSIARIVKMFRDEDLPLPKWAQAWSDPAVKQALEAGQSKSNAEKPPRDKRGRRQLRQRVKR